MEESIPSCAPPTAQGGGQDRYSQFTLVLMLTDRCNLQCSYCYVTGKGGRVLSGVNAYRAIDRAIASLQHGGKLELGFFGGEPLLEADALLELWRYATAADIRLTVNLTTNGTVTSAKAWQILTRPELALSISCDGPPDVHDRFRRAKDGSPSSAVVYDTMARLRKAGKEFTVVCVVAPQTAARLGESFDFLRQTGATSIAPALNLWARWTKEDLDTLERELVRCADLWSQARPHVALSWFDEKAALLGGIALPPCSRCNFGAGAVAVAPSGHLYPCERLIGGDGDDNPCRLEGHVDSGRDFLNYLPHPCRSHAACANCEIAPYCDTTCRCSNWLRTGDVAVPDRLLCRLNQVCVREVLRVFPEKTKVVSAACASETAEGDGS